LIVNIGHFFSSARPPVTVPGTSGLVSADRHASIVIKDTRARRQVPVKCLDLPGEVVKDQPATRTTSNRSAGAAENDDFAAVTTDGCGVAQFKDYGAGAPGGGNNGEASHRSKDG
jgi:hypothetical protein